MPVWEVRFDLHVDVDAPEIVRAVARAEALASVIRGLPVPPHVRKKLDRLNILRAVRGTTGIEGSDLSEEEVGVVMDSERPGPVLPRPRAREEQEVRNAARAMQSMAGALRRDPQLPLTEELISTIHRLTTEGIGYEHNTPGVYRSHAVAAGTYVPPRTRAEVESLMRGLIEWFCSPRTQSWPAAVRAVAAHFYFVSVHPFGDGNGRTARAIESLLLYQGHINALGFYSLSNFYYRRRPEYIEHLDSARFAPGGLTPLVRFALEGLVSELEEVHGEVLREMTVIAFRDFARERLKLTGKLGSPAGERLYQLLVELTEPVRPAEIRRGQHALSRLYRGLSAKTFSRDLQFLQSEALIVEEGDTVRANLALMQDFMP
ncbi:MAG: Fic family protein [Dehalococcoidia bacterium]